jgi:hypothetical protein
MSVLLLPARSALPPIRFGMTAASALSTLPLELRVASPLPAGKTGSAASQPAGSSPAIMRWSSAASAG